MSAAMEGGIPKADHPIDREQLVARFLQYVAIETQSHEPDDDDAGGETELQIPSTPCQWNLARLLKAQLEELGLEKVSLNEHCTVMGFLPASPGCEGSPVIGLLAHMDTSPETSGKDVHPRIIKSYDGGNIILNEEKGISMSPEMFPRLSKHVGNDIIVTDGTTLLGADDKCGVAEIMTAVSYLITHPEIKHAPVAVAFTPDEEIGLGIKLFSTKSFGADFAFTVDGGPIGEIEYESFNGRTASIVFHGTNMHPGYPEGRMVNAILMMGEFIAQMPPEEIPEKTSGYEGFFHIIETKGSVSEAHMTVLLRDFEKTGIERRKNILFSIATKLCVKYGPKRVEISFKKSYNNFGEFIGTKYMHVVERAKQATSRQGISPVIVPIRGGSDGCTLAEMGLACPNLWTGSDNWHGIYEFADIDHMVLATSMLVSLVTTE